MSAVVAQLYDVRWSPTPYRIWQSSFKSILFRYGANPEKVREDEAGITIIDKEEFYKVIDNMSRESQSYKLLNGVTVEAYIHTLKSMLGESSSVETKVRIKWTS